MKTIDNFNFKNQRALIRVDFNVPLNTTFEITDATRINAALPTLKKILNDGGSAVLMSHLGRPKEGYEEKFSLKHLVKPLKEKLGVEVLFADDCVGEKAFELSASLKPNQVLLLENLRFYKEETAGVDSFAAKLAKHGDIYINDAFGTAHRAHASTTIVAKYFPQTKCFGYVMAQEIENINKVLKNGKKPITAILGGAKVSGKILIIEKLMPKVDNLIIGGGMAYTFIKALGGSIGASLVEEDRVETAKEIIARAKQTGVNLLIPIDTIVASKFDNDADKKACDIYQIPEEWLGLDIGEKTIKNYQEVIASSQTILWNGPMGVFEFSNFEYGTKKIAEALVEATKNGVFTLVGGGDSVAAVNKYNMANDVSYVSTGGGAMLEYLEGKELPGIAAINT